DTEVGGRFLFRLSVAGGGGILGGEDNGESRSRTSVAEFADIGGHLLLDGFRKRSALDEDCVRHGNPKKTRLRPGSAVREAVSGEEGFNETRVRLPGRFPRAPRGRTPRPRGPRRGQDRRIASRNVAAAPRTARVCHASPAPDRRSPRPR